MKDMELIQAMEQHISKSRLEKINKISKDRTNYISVVLEDIYYTQNLSAVIRSCDCLGIQNVYIIGQESAKINKHVALGAANWVDVHHQTKKPKIDIYNNLKKKGYKLIATLPDPSAKSIFDYDILGNKTALIMGNELEGISKETRDIADGFVTIPMYGFSDSFNISVSAALILSEFVRKLNYSDITWKLSDNNLNKLRYKWIKNSIKRPDEIETEYLKRMSHPNDQN